MKTWTEKEIVDMIYRADNKILGKMLLSLYERQTADERAVQGTRWDNGIGFSAFDSKFLSSVAEGVKKFGHVTDKQAVYVRKGLEKYRKQLVEIANWNEQKKAAGAQPAVKSFETAYTDEMNKRPWGGIFERRIDNAGSVEGTSGQNQEALQRSPAVESETRGPQPGAENNHGAVRGALGSRPDGHVEVRGQGMEPGKQNSPQPELKHVDGVIDCGVCGTSSKTKPSVDLKPEALQGNLYSKTWEEVFNKEGK